jgi:hypothetical protein
MKKILYSILMIGFSIISYSQCNTGCITGNLSITLGQTATFSSPAAQCTSCYDWDINSNTTSSDNQTVGTVKIVGTDMGQTVQIQGIAVGAFSLQLTYFDETGCHTCCFNGNVVSSTVTPLPTVNCFGFDPVQGTPDITAQGLLNYGYLGSPYGTPISSIGLTFTWYFKFQDGTLLTFNVQNPTFRELCPTNPVKSFALIVSNGVQTRQYKSIVAGYSIPGVSGANTPTCFIHPDCSLGAKSANSIKIIVSPNPTNSIIKFNGENLSDYEVSIFNSNGYEVVKKSKINQNISLEKQEKGVYLYIITNENGFRQEGKIIKE